MKETMRAVLAPALEQFKRLVAAKRARGATDEDISKMLGELEGSMREIGIMSDAKIRESMQIYHEALREEATQGGCSETSRRYSRDPVRSDPRWHGRGTKEGYARSGDPTED